MNNRELKFRIWNYLAKQFTYCGLDDYPSGMYGGNVTQQFIGLKDKNDNEIYEGDIVYLDYANLPEGHNKENLFLIEFSHGSFVVNPKKLAFKDGSLLFPVGKQLAGLDENDDEIWESVWPGPKSVFDFNILVVTGNIFETPDLLNNNK